MNFAAEHRCPFCDKPQQQNTAYDYFIQCNHLRLEKRKWIEILKTALSKIFTPPNLREAILDRVYNYYDSNLRDAGRVAFDESNSYDSRSGSEASIASRRGQRRIIEPEDDQNTEDENSTSNRSEESILMNPRRKMISRMEANSMESDEVCLEFASNGSNASSTSRLIEPFLQDFTSKQQNNTRPTETRNNEVMAGVEESVREPIDNINIEECMDLGEEELLQLNDGCVGKDWSTGYNEDNDYC